MQEQLVDFKKLKDELHVCIEECNINTFFDKVDALPFPIYELTKQRLNIFRTEFIHGISRNDAFFFQRVFTWVNSLSLLNNTIYDVPPSEVSMNKGLTKQAEGVYKRLRKHRISVYKSNNKKEIERSDRWLDRLNKSLKVKIIKNEKGNLEYRIEVPPFSIFAFFLILLQLYAIFAKAQNPIQYYAAFAKTSKTLIALAAISGTVGTVTYLGMPYYEKYQKKQQVKAIIQNAEREWEKGNCQNALELYQQADDLNVDDELVHQSLNVINLEKTLTCDVKLFSVLDEHNERLDFSDKSILNKFVQRVLTFLETKQKQENVNQANIYFNMGKSYAKLGNYDNALTKFNEAVRLDSTNVDYRLERSKVFMEHHNFESALEDVEKILSVDSTLVEAWITKGIISYKHIVPIKKHAPIKIIPNQTVKVSVSVDHDVAKYCFDKAEKLAPNNPKVYSARALFYEHTKKPELAMIDFSKAIDLNSDNAHDYSNRASLYEKLGKIDLAIADFNKAIELYPSHYHFYANLANIFLQQDQFALADALIDRALKINNSHCVIYTIKAQICYEQENYSEGLEMINKALTLEGDNDNYSDCYVVRGHIYFQIEKYQEAFDDFTQAITLNDKSTVAYHERGHLYQHIAKRMDLACQDFKKAYELGDQSDEIINHLQNCE